jgi:hypothetical protein
VAEVLPEPRGEESGAIDPRLLNSEQRLQLIQIMDAAQAGKGDGEHPG